MEFKKGNKSIYLGESESNYDAIITYDKVGDDVLNITHTIVKPHLEGQGIAGKLVDEMVSFARENNLKLEATCSYAVHKFNTVEEYKDVLE